MIGPVTPLTLAQQRVVDAEVALYPYWRRALIAFDQFCNVLFFAGLVDETVSAHAGRMAVRGTWRAVWLCNALDYLESNHGAKACAADLYRAMLVIQVEQGSGNLLSVVFEPGNVL